MSTDNPAVSNNNNSTPQPIQSTLTELFSSTVVASVINRKFDTPIVLRSDMSLTEAIAILSQAQISSAPVVSSTDNAIHFILDFKNICEIVVRYIEASSNKHSTLMERLFSLEKGADYDALLSDLTLDLEHVTFQGKEDGIPCIRPSDSLLHACNIFSKGVHRILVIDDDGNFDGVISQSDLIQFILKRFDVTKPYLQKTLAQLNLARKDTVCIPWTESVFDGVKRMVDKKVSSLGLLDEENLLAGVFSMTDIKYIFHFRDFQCLKDSLCAFVCGIRQISEALKGKTHYPLFSVRPDTTLDAVVHKLVSTHSHRVYVSEDMEPVGVVTLTDVIRSLPLFQ